jgi:hypothetical protein
MPAEDDEVTWGQVVDASSAKSAETLGFSPAPEAGKVSGALPMFLSVTVCGLSLLCDPAVVLAKLRLGAVTRLNSYTLLA